MQLMTMSARKKGDSPRELANMTVMKARSHIRRPSSSGAGFRMTRSSWHHRAKAALISRACGLMTLHRNTADGVTTAVAATIDRAGISACRSARNPAAKNSAEIVTLMRRMR